MMYLAALFILLTGLLLYRALSLKLVIGYYLFGFLVFVGAFDLLGDSKPIKYEWRTLKNVALLSYFPVEDEGIYVWLLVDGKPRGYILPWKTGDAEDIEEAIRMSEGEGGQVTFTETPVEDGYGDYFKLETPERKQLPPK